MYPSVKFSDKEIQTTYYVLKAGDDAERKGRCPPARGCSVIKKADLNASLRQLPMYKKTIDERTLIFFSSAKRLLCISFDVSNGYSIW